MASARSAASVDQSRSGSVTVGRRTIRLTHADRVVFPDLGITKAELVDYYRRVAPVMVPFLRGRPLMLQRLRGDLPTGQLFYQKEAPDYFPSWIRRVTVSKRRGTVTHAICDDAATLVYLAQPGRHHAAPVAGSGGRSRPTRSARLRPRSQRRCDRGGPLRCPLGSRRLRALGRREFDEGAA